MSLVPIAAKEGRDVLRDKSIVVAFMIQLFLAGFSALLLTGLTVLYSPDALAAAPDADVAYVGPGGFDAYLDDAGNLGLVRMETGPALEAFRDGSITAVVQEAYQDPDGVRTVTVLLADGELTGALLVNEFQSLLQEYENDLRADRADRLEHELLLLDVGDAPQVPYGFVYGTLMPLLVITPVFLSGAIAGDALSMESRTRTLLILRSAPVRVGTLIAGKLAVPILLVPVQVSLWLLLFWANGFSSDPWGVLATATLLGVLLCCAGTLVAVLVQNESATQAVYALLVLFLAVLSLLLPRDPLNLIALLATGRTDAAVASSLAWLAGATVLTAWVAVAIARRRIRTDRF